MKKHTESSDRTERAMTRTHRAVPEGFFSIFGALGYIDGTHEGMIEGLDHWCKRTLTKAGFPTDPSVFYKPETGERLEGQHEGDENTLIHLVSPERDWSGRKLPFYPIDSREGFAARLLTALFKFRLLFDSGEIQDALMVHAGLWFLAAKAEDKFTFQAFRLTGAQNLRSSKWLPGLQHATDELVKESPHLSASDIWETTIKYDSAGIEVDGRKYDVYRDGDKLFQLDTGTGKIASVKLRAFERYVRRAKARLRK